MSSTNRSEARSYHIADYYVTPIEKILDFIDAFIETGEDFEGLILDPCAGGDKDHPMSYPEALKQRGYNNIITLDVRKDSLADIKGNYLNTSFKDGYLSVINDENIKWDYPKIKKPNIIITNPPFNQAREIIDKALDDVEYGGYVIMLLRLNFFGGKLRKDLWEKHMPRYAFVHNRRMSFTDDKKTDSIEYMHCVWQKGYNPVFTQLKVI